MSDRVIVYVDGLNLHHGLRQQYGRRYHWLDLEALAGRMLAPGQHLRQVHYFTARVRGDPGSVSRQSDYLDALAARCPRLTVTEGRFQEKRITCRSCGFVHLTYEEKETDVNIATALHNDATLDRYDTALLVSGDSDLSRVVRDINTRKRVVIAFPPARHSVMLAQAARRHFHVPQAAIRNSQLPEAVMIAGGIKLERPVYWR
jgi:uncharacterized LabA/DUF88 family protein